MNSLSYFFISRSGYVKPRDGLAMGWLGIMLMVVVMALGITGEAQAYIEDEVELCCSYIGPNQDRWCCTPYQGNCDPSVNLRIHVLKDSQGECWWVDATCSCF